MLFVLDNSVVSGWLLDSQPWTARWPMPPWQQASVWSPSEAAGSTHTSTPPKQGSVIRLADRPRKAPHVDWLLSVTVRTV